jgi:hypothetical protein
MVPAEIQGQYSHVYDLAIAVVQQRKRRWRERVVRERGLRERVLRKRANVTSKTSAAGRLKYDIRLPGSSKDRGL